MTDMLTALIDKSQERREEWKTTEVATLPDPYTLNQPALLGTYSYTLIRDQERLLRTKDAVKLTDSMIETPPAVARDYLNIKYKRGPILKASQRKSILDGLTPVPNVAIPSTFEHGLYIDIKSAYWSILNIVGWNVDYYPGRWLAPGSLPVDFPFPGHKVARNCLISAGRPNKILRFRPDHDFQNITPGSPLTNWGLTRIINDVLNGIAFHAIQAGAVYANTDGYIAPSPQVAAAVIRIIFDWGLIPEVRAEGRGAVRGSGAYQVGAVTSIPFKARREAREIHALYKPKYAKWLQERFSFWGGENRIEVRDGAITNAR